MAFVYGAIGGSGAGAPKTNINAHDPGKIQNPGGGTQLYPLTYIGKVKKVHDEDKMGRIWVHIKELDGFEEDESHWHQMSYCTPFGGGTPISDNKSDPNYQSSQTSYGMWLPQPDLDNEVICMFINGDPNKGIWIGNLFKQNMNHMVPGVAATLTEVGYLPAGEYNKHKEVTSNPSAPIRPVNEPVAQGLKFQGLDKDSIRGLQTGNSQRQSLSRTYGMSTPRGSQFVIDDGFLHNETQPGYNPESDQRGDKHPAKEWKVGDINNVNPESRKEECIRLKTRSGAQILISESEGIIYLVNRDGSAWVELAADGKIDVFANSDVSVHSYGSVNMTAQKDVNIEAGGSINMKSRGGNIRTQASGSIEFTTGTDLNLLVGGNGNILAASALNVRSDSWNQNVNFNHSLCVGENQNINVNGELRSDVVGNASYNYMGTHSSVIEGKRSTRVKSNDELMISQKYKIEALAGVEIVTDANILSKADSYEVTAPTINLDGALSMGGGGGVATFKGDIKVAGKIHASQEIKAPTVVPDGGLASLETSLTFPQTVEIPPFDPPVLVTPDVPGNPAVATQPTVNTLSGNKSYGSSICGRVPEHEPWQGHRPKTPSSHAPYDGPSPNGGINEVQEMAAQPPAGSTAFAGQAPGGDIKGNTKPELATVDFDAVKEKVQATVANPLPGIPFDEISETLATDLSTAAGTVSESVLGDLYTNIAGAVGDTASLISTAISDAYAAIEPMIQPIIDEVVAMYDGMTNIIGQVYDYVANITENIVNGIKAAIASTIGSVQSMAQSIIDGAIEQAAFVADTVGGLVAGVESSIEKLIFTPFAKASEAVQHFIADNELYVPFEYPSTIDAATGTMNTAIGYGHQIIGDLQTAGAKFANGLTEEEAFEVLTKQDLPKLEAHLIKKLKKPVLQHQFDAMLDLAYNRGPNNPAVKGVINAFNDGKMEEVAKHFMSNHATVGGDLIARRVKNVEMFFQGKYEIGATREELKKSGLSDFILPQWNGEHLWKQFPGFKHKEFPDAEVTKRVVNQAYQVFERSTQKPEFALPEKLKPNKLVERVGGEQQLQKAKKKIIEDADKIAYEFVG